MTQERSLRKQVEDFNNLIINGPRDFNNSNVWVYFKKRTNKGLIYQPFIYKEALIEDFFKLFERVFKRWNQTLWKDYGFFFIETDDIERVDVNVIRNVLNDNADRIIGAVSSIVDDYYKNIININIDCNYSMSLINKNDVKTIKKFKLDMDDMIKNFEISFNEPPNEFAEHSYILKECGTENKYTLRASRMDIKNVFFNIKEKKIEPPLKLHTIRDGIHIFDIWEIQKFKYFYYETIRTEQDLLSLKIEYLDSYFNGFQNCSNAKNYIDRDIV